MPHSPAGDVALSRKLASVDRCRHIPMRQRLITPGCVRLRSARASVARHVNRSHGHDAHLAPLDMRRWCILHRPLRCSSIVCHSPRHTAVNPSTVSCSRYATTTGLYVPSRGCAPPPCSRGGRTASRNNRVADEVGMIGLIAKPGFDQGWHIDLGNMSPYFRRARLAQSLFVTALRVILRIIPLC